MLSEQTKAIIAATLPAVKENALAITGTFYPLMFERYPQVKAYFNESHQREGTQRQALANAVVAYASNLERLEILGDALQLIIHKHASLNILPEHYPIVGECLLAAIKKVFGEVATEEVLGAWGALYQQLADSLIAAEEALYQTNAQKHGGWRGEREFVLVRKTPESEVITSFYFEPADHRPLTDFQAGQYVGIRVTVDGRPLRRNYSLSNPPGESYYRLSIKREEKGVISNFLHDSLQPGDRVFMTPPVGDFVLEDSARPLVLLTGGVGITPAISMLKPALASGRQVHFIHGAINGRTHAFKNHVTALVQQHANLAATFAYSAPDPGDHYHFNGFVDQPLLERLVPHLADCVIYLLGPRPFMESCYSAARNLGVPEAQIHFEFFGPLQPINSASTASEAA